MSTALEAAAVSNGLLVVVDAASALTGKTHNERGDEGLRKSQVASILEHERGKERGKERRRMTGVIQQQ